MRSETHLVDVLGTEKQAREEVLVPVEQPLSVRVNEQLAAVIMRQPGDDLELAIGYCLAEGIISEADNILSVQPSKTDVNTIDVLIEGTHPSRPRQVGAGCVNAEDMLGLLPEALPVDSGPSWAATDLLGMIPQFRKNQEQHQRSGGTHGAALFDKAGELVVLREDISRHNTVDKVVGYCITGQIQLSEMALLVSGRASSTMVTKAVRAGIRLVATMSNTTSLGVELAERLGLTLVTYLRGAQFRVCTHPCRIVSKPSVE